MSQRNYPMKCERCPTNGMFFNLYDAYAEGWKSFTTKTTMGEHCPQHVTKDDFEYDYNMKCAYCKEEGLFVDLDDAIDSGWWTMDEWDFCPECASDVIEQQQLENDY